MSIISDFAAPWETETEEQRRERERGKFQQMIQPALENFHRLQREEEARSFREQVQPIVDETQRREQEQAKFHDMIAPAVADFQQSQSPTGRFADRFDEVNKFHEGVKDILAEPTPQPSVSRAQTRALQEQIAGDEGSTYKPELVGLRGLFEPALSKESISSRIPGPVGEVVGDIGAGLTSPAGIIGLGAGLVSPIALGVLGTSLGGSVAGGLAGKGLEEAGVPDIPTPIGDVSPSTIGEIGGGVIGSIAPGAVNRVRTSFSRSLPASLRGLGEEAAAQPFARGLEEQGGVTGLGKRALQGEPLPPSKLPQYHETEKIWVRDPDTGESYQTARPLSFEEQQARLSPEQKLARAEEAARAAGKREGTRVGGVLASPAENVEQPLWQTAVTKVLQAAKDARENYAATDAIRSVQRGKRGAAYEEILQREIAQDPTDLLQAHRIASAPLKGPYEPIPGVQVDLSAEERTALTMRLMSADLRNFERRNATEALVRLQEGKPITPYYSNLLERVYGSEFGQVIKEAAQTKGGLSAKLFDLLVLPKAVLSSFDLSYPLRQGVMLAPGHPKEFLGSFMPMFKAWGSEANARNIIDGILNDGRNLDILTASGATITKSFGQVKDDIGLLRSLEMAGPQAEEAMRGGGVYRKTLAEYIPFVSRSNRAFVTFGNKFRSDTFDTIVANWTEAKVPLTEERLQDLGNMLNRFTGRGTIMNDNRLTQLLQATWWAPQYRLSGPEAVAQLFHKDPYIRKEAARNVVAFVGTGMSLLTAAKLSGVGDVNANPMSSDFGKIRVGNTRINLWGNNSVLARTGAQVALNLARGKAEAARDSALRYARSGLAPEWGLGLDIAAGKNYLGESMNLEGANLLREAKQRLIPLAIQDIIDATQEAFANPSAQTIGTAAAVAPLSIFGSGIQTYISPTEALQQAYDQKMKEGAFGPDAKAYGEEASAIRQSNIARDPELQKLNLERDTESQRVNAATEQPLIPTARAVNSNLPDAGEAYRAKRGAVLAKRADQKEILFKDIPGREEDKLADQYYAIQPRDQNGNGFVDSEDMRAFFKERDAALAQIPERLRAAITDPIKRFNDPATVQAEIRYEKALDAYKRYQDIPKYEGLSAEQGEMVDNALSAIDYVRQTSGIPPEMFSRRQALPYIQNLPDNVAEYVLLLTGKNSQRMREGLEDPRRDELLKRFPDMAYFGLVSTRTLKMGERSGLPEFVQQNAVRPAARQLVGVR